MKQCLKCKKKKPLTEFSDCPWTPDHKNVVCKPCEALAEHLDPNQVARALSQLTAEQFNDYEEELLKQQKDAGKKCSYCEEHKPLDQFNQRADAIDGLQNYCKPCQSELNRLWRENNFSYNQERKHAQYKDLRPGWHDTIIPNVKMFI